MLLELPMLIPSISIIVVMIASVLVCICGCRRKIPRNELLGLAGMVKITNPDLHTDVPVIMSVLPATSQNSSSMKPSPEISTMRSATVSNSGTVATRSLPDLPVEIVTVGSTIDFLIETDVVDGNITTDNVVQNISIDTGSELYATVEENKTREHHYSQVGSTNIIGTSTDQFSTATRSIPEQNELVLIPEPVNNDTPNGGDIPAACAISGVIAANSEIPYMTPPLQQTTYFSGDSQDSFKGYTSISVREPISQIMPLNHIQDEILDPHYIALSDDSDEMYAAIADAYASGSDTYAQIWPVSTSGITNSSNTLTEISAATSSSHHSRDGSSSSVISLVVNQNLNERREANSPLPKPPLDVTDMYAKIIKKRKTDWSNVNHPSPTADENSKTKENNSSSEYETLFPTNGNYAELPVSGYATVDKKPTMSYVPGYESVSDCKSNTTDKTSATQLHYEQTSEPGYEEIH